MSFDILAGVLAGLGGAAGVWALMRFVAPLVGGMATSVISVKRDLDLDRERVLTNLRAEITDLNRRNSALSARATIAEADRDATREKLADSEAFIEKYLRHRDQ